MRTNFLVIGSGISGLNFALHAAQKGKVTLITKKKLIDSNTNYAQGGIAAVLDKTDQFQKHVKDTIKAGAFHNNKRAVKFMVRHSPEAIFRLIELGVEFEKHKGKLKLTQEGGHNKKRIAYIGDYTGKEIEKTLVKRALEHPQIEIFENTFALSLITERNVCFGAQVITSKDRVENIFADQTILATGGAGQLYKHTTNPKIATSDGLAMGIEAGLKTKDLEFIQFHPTALAKRLSPMFLISETVRGEGAKLINKDGEEFMKNRHPQGNLAPRDIVAREIYNELKNGGVFLDIRHKKASFLKKRFPQIFEKLKKHGINMSKDLIPVTPAAHYLCGGLVTNLKGQTKLKNLFAFGEVTCTGVHGANRLASNSLLEALVFSNQIANKLKVNKNFASKMNLLKIVKPRISPSTSPNTQKTKKLKKEIQKTMWKYAGITRNRKLIKTVAIPKIEVVLKELQKIKSTNKVIQEVRNMAITSLEILKASYKRRQSKGCHFIE